MENLSKLEDCKEFENEAIGKITKGEIPSWLNGTLVRIGPGKWGLGESFTLNHLLDGYAMMVRFEFEQTDGGQKRVRAKSRFLRSEAYKKWLSQKKSGYTEFGTPAYTDTSKSFERVNILKTSDNCNLNVFVIAKEVYLSNGSCYIWKIHPNTLDSLLKVS
jgi:carotenoid cleavage dioxygenase-like enzyme